jgi:hypothetical protein
MAIAIHLGERPTTKMDYDFEDLSHTTSVCSGAWKVLRGHPKWQGDGPILTGTALGQDAESCGTSDDDDETLSIIEGESGTEAKHGGARDAVESDGRWKDLEASVNTTDVAETGKRSAPPPVGRKKAKDVRRENVSLHAVMTMATSMAASVDSIEKSAEAHTQRNGIMLFSGNVGELDGAGKLERDEYLKLLRKPHLFAARKASRLSIATSEEADGESDN